MNIARIWTLGAVVAVVALLGGAFALGVLPRLDAASAADANTTMATAQNNATTIQLATLSKVAAKESALQATEAVLEKRVPSSLKLNTFSRELRTIAALDGVSIMSLVPGAGTPYAAPSDATVAVATASTTASSTSTPTPTPTPSASATAAAVTATTAATDAKSPWFGKTDPSITEDDFTVVPVSVTVSGSPSAVLNFTSGAEGIDRLFAVTTYSSNDVAGVTTATLTGSIYALDR